LRRCQRVHGFGHSLARAPALKARQNSNSDVRAVKRITMRTPSTSNCRIAAIQTGSAIRVSVKSPNSRQRWKKAGPPRKTWHFEISSSGRFFDHDKATELSRDNAELIGMTGRMLADALAQGQLRPAELKRLQIAGRALVYGFARMNLDGHLARWGVAAAEVEVECTAEAILDLFIDGIASRPGPA
jgi:hypothetical protein